MATLLVLALAACASGDPVVTDGGDSARDASVLPAPDAAPRLDAGAEHTDASTDGGRADAGVDAGVTSADAGRVDAGELDAGYPEGECDLVTQEPCLPMRACRRVDEPGGASYSPPRGPPTCVSAGWLLDDMYGTTRRCDDDSADPGYRCRRGSYCQPSGACRRFCDPEGDPCPPTAGGWPRECRAADVGIDPYCWPVGT